MRLVDRHARNVPLRDVGRLVGEDARQLILTAGCEHEAAVDRDEAARPRPGIDLGVAYDEIVELVLALLGMAGEPVAEFLDVFADLRILEDLAGVAHAADDHQADAVFVIQGNGRIRGAAQFRQFLICGGVIRHIEAGRPRHADAGGRRNSGEQGARGI